MRDPALEIALNRKSFYNFTGSFEFTQLQLHYETIKNYSIPHFFAAEPFRFERFHLKEKGFFLDYSKNHITRVTMSLLSAMAEAADVEFWRDRMFAGERINASENRSVLHVALRGSTQKNIRINGENIAQFVTDTLNRIKTFSTAVRHEAKIKDIVNIGIGGSDLGPHLACEALKQKGGPRIHFVSNIDPEAMCSILKNAEPSTTLFIISSKTFTTLETLTNAQTAKDWITNSLTEKAVPDHLCAVTMNDAAARDLGIKSSNIFPLRDWIGGRYSIWSAIGLTIAIAGGYEIFEKLLQGARDMDTHFRNTRLERNIPVIAALLGIWQRNFWNYPVQAVLPYSEKLRLLPAYLQQLCMESNGKNVSRDGNFLDYNTGPIIFGAAGTDAQHSFMQLLHQSQTIIPCEFLLIKKASKDSPAHAQLNINAVAQSCALMHGSSSHSDEPYRTCLGNRPSTSIVLDSLDAYHLGLLLAFYEHKTFVEGLIWNINSFDQWGVELGKSFAKNMTQKQQFATFDGSTRGLVNYLKL